MRHFENKRVTEARLGSGIELGSGRESELGFVSKLGSGSEIGSGLGFGLDPIELTPLNWSAGLITHPDLIDDTLKYMALKNLKRYDFD
jgi:hypothetical protein